MKAAISNSQIATPRRILLALTMAIGAAVVMTADVWVSNAHARGFAAYGRGGGMAYGRGDYMRYSRPIDSVGPGPGPDRRVQYPGAVGYAAGRRAAYNTAAVLPYLPDNCSITAGDNGVVYNCNGVYYQPYYQGTEVEYVPIAPPQ
jgi:hypothetical protein